MRTWPAPGTPSLSHVMRGTLLTSHLPLLILPVFQDGVRDPHPRVVLAELREQVMGHKAHGAGQDEQHDAEDRLQGQRARLGTRAAGGRPPGPTEQTGLPWFPRKGQTSASRSRPCTSLPRGGAPLCGATAVWEQRWGTLPTRILFFKKRRRITQLASRLFLVERIKKYITFLYGGSKCL